jgi:hypothetical protein
MAGTITETKNTFLGGNMMMLKFACVGDAALGTFPATASAYATGGYLSRVVVDPGATPPDAAFDITITDVTGVDLMGGKLTNLSETATFETPPYYSDAALYGDKPFMGALTITITGTAAVDAIIDIYVFVRIKD